MKELTRHRGLCGESFSCSMTVTDIDDCDLMRYTTYGIRLVDTEGNELATFADISTNKSFVERFIQLCYDYQVAAVHVLDFLEDFLD